MKLIFRPYFHDRDGKIHYPKNGSKVFPMWVPCKD